MKLMTKDKQHDCWYSGYLLAVHGHGDLKDFRDEGNFIDHPFITPNIKGSKLGTDLVIWKDTHFLIFMGDNSKA